MSEAGVHIAIVGGGIAGALLALRLTRAPRPAQVDLFLGRAPLTRDASHASGGMVRGFEPDPAATRLAAESLAELRGSATLREWSGYRETGSVYVPARGSDPTGSLEILDHLLPRSATLVDRDALAREHRLRDLPEGAVGVVERRAGHISPHRLRAAVLDEIARAKAVVHRADVRQVTTDPAVRTADGALLRYDAVVVAAGAWTPRLLEDSGLPGAGLRTKQIQYSVCRTGLDDLPPFVEENSGLYGRRMQPGAFLLGLPTDRWDVHPDEITRDHALAEQVVTRAERLLGVPVRALRTVASFDCYSDPSGLALRRVSAAGGLFTFTGGSGGAAKTAVAASRAAADALL